MRITWIGAILALMVLAAACGTDRSETATGERLIDRPTPETTVAPTRVTATTVAAPTTTTTIAPTTTTTAPLLVEAEPVLVGGPGVDHAVFIEALAPLVQAEMAMHDFEAAWDAGMTYSETFQGWREVKSTVVAALDGFVFPEDASTEQLTVGTEYLVAVQGAHDEWQNVTDFIVTYITNYTPEVLIQAAYSKAEFRLRDAIAAYDAIAAMGS